MTALAGIWRFDGRSDADQSCQRILTSQKLYGPHDSGRWSDGTIALGRQLMRVLPEDTWDRQPLIGGRGRFVLVANIRLDNREDLIKSLRIPPDQAPILCDAAILLAAIERWNEKCLERIVGDYAFALWDAAEHHLVLARDPLGQRPLHYHRARDFFAFASMPKGLHALPEVPYSLDEDKVAETLVLLPDTGNRTFFLGIERVEPGHIVTIANDTLTSRKYWEPRRQRLALKTPDEYGQALREQLDQAVKCRLRGTGNAGVYLSGGLDSGAVAATAARLLAGSGRRLIAFTSVPRDGYSGSAPRNRLINEGALASATAAMYPEIEHVLVPNVGHSPVADLDRYFYLLDRPAEGLSWSGWAHSLDVAMRRYDLKIVLGGGFGNLTMSYDGMELLPELLRSGRWLHLFREWRALVQSGWMTWRGALVHTFGPWFPAPFWVWIHRLAKREIADLRDYSAINPSRFAEINADHIGKHDFAFRPRKDGFEMRSSLLQTIDFGNGYLGGLGTWQTDSRDPTADIRLVEFCLSVPTEQYLRNGIPRALAKHAFADRLPGVVLHERRRGLQAADWHEDLISAREDLVRELERIETCPAAERALDLPRLRDLIADWPTKGWEQANIVMSYRYALLRAIAMGHFVRRATRGNQ